MPIVRIEHAVPDFNRWRLAFDSDPADRKGSGVRGYQILRLCENPNHVMIDLEFDDVDHANAFLEKMQRIWSGPGKAVMQNPTAKVVDLVERKLL
jgi:hypothetical protein